MTTTEHAATASTEIGGRHADDLANRIRALAATDPYLAQDLVEQLIENLNRATDGAFQEHLDDAVNRPVEVISPLGNS